MKLLTFTFLSLLTYFSLFAQDEAASASSLNVDVPVHIQDLYDEGRALETTGTAAQINQNRLDIISAWEAYNPAVAALYKPVNSQGLLPETMENVHINGYANPGTDYREPELQSVPEWGPDLLVHEGLVDGIDMVINGTDIYIGVYERIIDFGGTLDSIWIYKSTDEGRSFNLWEKTAVTAAMRKMQLIMIGPGADSHVCAYLLTASNTFQVFRWRADNGNFQAQVIDTDCVDFAVDRNYPGAGGQRVFAAYTKDDACTDRLYSARSTAGSFGFDWVDQSSFNNICVVDIDLAYGRDGGVYVTNLGASSGNLYTHVNENFADPAMWAGEETLETGASTETHDPQIIATRKAPANDEVMVIYSHRNAGSTDGYNSRYQRRDNGGAFGSPANYQTTAPATYAIEGIDFYSNRVNNNEVVQGCYVRDRLDGSAEDLIRYKEYDGTAWSGFEVVTDIDVSVTVSPATAVLNGDALLAYVGMEVTNCYFNAKSGITGINDVNLEELGYSLGQNYPNPVSNFTQFGLHLTEAKDIRIVVTDVLGREVAEVVNEFRSAGDHIIYWEPTVAPGAYFYQLQIGDHGITKQMIVQ